MEPMKRHLAPSLFALAFCALLGGARAAEAQGADAIVPTAIDSVASGPARSAVMAIATATSVTADFAPVMRPTSPVVAGGAGISSAVPVADYPSVFGRDWKMPTSR